MPELENPFPEAGHRRADRSRVASVALVGAGLALALALGLLAAFLSSRQEVATFRETVARLEQQISAVASDVASTDNRIASLESSGSSQIAGDAPSSIVATDLPRYPQTGQDTALGLKLNSLSGVHFYDGQVKTFDPADGKSRAWLVWAHW